MGMISDQYAVYLPAINTLYAEVIAKPLPEGRPFPSSFTLDDLYFWKKGNKLWHHPYVLHSVGGYKVGTLPDNAVTRRGRTDGVLVGDSGGFQIGKGTLNGLDTLKAGMTGNEACAAWREAYNVRVWILNWLETHTNYAMTIDMPLWAKFEPASPFYSCTEDQLIQLTVENLQFIDTHRQNRTQWLNVIQGNNMTAIKKWWDAVKWFKGGGFALSSSAGRMSGLGAVIEPLLMMRDEQAFEDGRDWIHMLGVSTAPWAIMFTAIQKALRDTANPALRISYDSSSPFQDAGKRELLIDLPNFGTDTKSWANQRIRFKHSRQHVGSNEALPVSSPIADQLTLGYLNIRDDKGIYTPRQIDGVSLALVTNHNVWAFLETFQRANDLVFASNRSQVPDIYKELVDFINRVFSVETWADELVKEQLLLSQFNG
jgi:hypothetical protein